MTDMPEEIWCKNDSSKYAWHPKRLALTNDIKYTRSDHVNRLEGELEMSNEAIKLARKWLKKVDISAAFFDDCAALAAQRITLQAERITVLEDALREISEVWVGSEGFKPETAPEAYQRQLILEMYEIAKQALEKS